MVNNPLHNLAPPYCVIGFFYTTMKALLTSGLCLFFSLPHQTHAQQQAANPLARWHSDWMAPKYQAANTSASHLFHSAWEQEFLYLLNLARMNPKLFAKTVVQPYPDSSGNAALRRTKEYKSLITDLNAQPPLGLLLPDSLCWLSAQCHATSSGKAGYVGHTRQNNTCEKLMHLRAECCHYGESKPLDALLSLMIDENVPDLGHRRTLFSSNYSLVGISFKTHKTYNTNVVVDFY